MQQGAEIFQHGCGGSMGKGVKRVAIQGKQTVRCRPDRIFERGRRSWPTGRTYGHILPLRTPAVWLACGNPRLPSFYLIKHFSIHLIYGPSVPFLHYLPDMVTENVLLLHFFKRELFNINLRETRC